MLQLRIEWATHEAALFACQRWHYSGCMPSGKAVRVGVWEGERFIGVVLFSRGANHNMLAPYELTLSSHPCACMRARIMPLAQQYPKRAKEHDAEHHSAVGGAAPTRALQHP